MLDIRGKGMLSPLLVFGTEVLWFCLTRSPCGDRGDSSTSRSLELVSVREFLEAEAFTVSGGEAAGHGGRKGGSGGGCAAVSFWGSVCMALGARSFFNVKSEFETHGSPLSSFCDDASDDKLGVGDEMAKGDLSKPTSIGAQMENRQVNA